MNKLMLLLVVCTGFVASVPMSANALDSQVVSQNPHGEANLLIAQYPRNQDYNRDQDYRRNQNRDRQFTVYYRNRNDRQWTFEGYHNNRQDARRAANRLERRGYLTYVQVSREVNRGMNRG
jgi:septal ring-binding cell division protein DamX